MAYSSPAAGSLPLRIVAWAVKTTDLPLPRVPSGLGLYLAGLGPVVPPLLFYLREHR